MYCYYTLLIDEEIVPATLRNLSKVAQLIPQVVVDWSLSIDSLNQRPGL